MVDRIIIGDAIEQMRLIPSGTVDLIFTDPPYGIEYNDGRGLARLREVIFEGAAGKHRANPIMGDSYKEAQDTFKMFLIEAKRVLKKGANICICCGGGSGKSPIFAEWSILISKLFTFKQAVVWEKPGLGMGMHYRSCYEFILIGQKGSPAYRWNGNKKEKNVVRYKKVIPSAKQHPTQKPVGLIRHFVRLHSNAGDMVLDPFAGSGTTGAACILEGREYLLIEKDIKYLNLIQNVLSVQLELG